MTIPRERNFWLWYATAWLPLFAFYFFAFYLQGRMDQIEVWVGSVVNVLPDALLGIALVHRCSKLWRSGKPGHPVVQLIALGIAFTCAATGIKALLTVLLVPLVSDSKDHASYAGPLLLWHAFFSLLAFAVVTSVMFGSFTAERLREEEARRAQADLLRARSELKALRSQVNPHFLFNTLHSLRVLIGESPDLAKEAIVQLGDLLRYALRVQDSAEDGVLLREEWEFLRAYLALERLRLGERLRVEEEATDEALQSTVPAFVLQPLVENAIRHGISVRERGGTVWIHARIEDGALWLQVRDDGPGANGLATKGMGKGLDLLRQRLHALHGTDGSVEVTSSPQSGFSVTLRFPRAMESW